MKVLFLTDAYPPESLGGYETACWAMAEGLRRRGDQILVVTNRSASRVEPHVLRRLHRMKDSPSLLEQALWEILDERFLQHTIRSFQPDVISSWRTAFFFPSLYRVLRASGVPTIFNLHDLWLPAHLAAYAQLGQVWARPGNGLLKRLVKALVRRGLSSFVRGFRQPLSLQDVGLEHAVFCSRNVLWRHEQAGVPLRDARVLYNGIDLRQFGGAPREDEDTAAVLFVGRLAQEKGAHLVIQAAARLVQAGRKLRLTIVGIPTHPWEYAAELRELVRVEGLQDLVAFRDSVPKSELPELYRSHHVLAFPSSATEGFPMTLLEAMASGCAVVSTATGGSAELLEDGVNSLVCTPDDPVALAGRLDRLLADGALRRNLASRAAKQVRESYGLEAVCAATAEYYAEVRDFRRQPG